MGLDNDWLLLIFVLFLLSYVMYFFFLRKPKKNKIDPGFLLQENFTDGSEKKEDAVGKKEEEEAKKYWTHSQRVVDEEQDLKCIVSTIDGERYCVRDRQNIQAAVDLLAKVTKALEMFVQELKQKYPRDPDVDRLYKNYDARAVSEILPNSTFEAVTTNKGEEIEFCLLRKKNQPEKLIDEHTLFFVALHEITHIMCKEENHPPLFWKQFAFLLKEAKEMGFHEPRDYSKQPTEYCDRKITDSPYFNWRQYQSTYGIRSDSLEQAEKEAQEEPEDTNFDSFRPQE